MAKTLKLTKTADGFNIKENDIDLGTYAGVPIYSSIDGWLKFAMRIGEGLVVNYNVNQDTFIFDDGTPDTWNPPYADPPYEGANQEVLDECLKIMAPKFGADADAANVWTGQNTFEDIVTFWGSPRLTPGNVVPGALGIVTHLANGHMQSKLGTAIVNEDLNEDLIEVLQALGSTYREQIIFSTINNVSTTSPMVDNTLQVSLIRVRKSCTRAGMAYFQSTAGVYTDDNENKAAIFSVNISTGAATRVAISNNLPNQWKSSLNSIQKIPFSAPVALTPGIYALAWLFNASGSPGTVPAMGTVPNTLAGLTGLDMAGSLKLAGTIAAQNTIPASFNFSAVTAAVIKFWVATYE